MVNFSATRVSVLTAIIVIILQKIPRLYRLVRRKGLKSLIIHQITGFLLNFSYFKNQYTKKDQYVKESLQHIFLSTREDPTYSLPETSQPGIIEKLQRWAARDHKLQNGGRITGSIYHGGDDIRQITMIAMDLFTYANSLHPDIYPSVRQMESEIVQMTINLFNGKEETCGVLTSGGTESLLLAVLAYRE